MIWAFYGLTFLGLVLWIIVSSFVSFFRAGRALSRVRYLEGELARLKELLPLPPPAPVKLRPDAQPALLRDPEPAPEKASPPQPKKPAGLPGMKEVPPPKPAPAEAPAPALMKEPAERFDWEAFTGANLSAWVGGLALFLGASFFVKYSIDHNLIGPMARVTLGFLLGIGAILGGLWSDRERHPVTAHTLCASGAAILYASIFAAASFYGFIPMTVAFVMMALVTAASFLLAVELDSKYIAVLGLAGGFLTPPLLSTGADRALGLFGYVALLDIGLIMLAVRKRWGFLTALACAGTLMTQLGWTIEHFAVEKAVKGYLIWLAFPALFIGGSVYEDRRGSGESWGRIPAGLMVAFSLMFGIYTLAFRELGAMPWLSLTFPGILGVLITALAVYRDEFRPWHLGTGTLIFMALTTWMTGHLTPLNLEWGLFYVLMFALLFAAAPIALQRARPDASPYVWGNIYPLLMLVPLLIPILRHELLSPLIWPVVLVIDVVAVAAGLAVSMAWIGIAALAGTMILAAAWLMQVPDAASLPGLLAAVGMFSCGFFILGLWRMSSKEDAKPADDEKPSSPALDPSHVLQLPALSALAPFVLLILASLHLTLTSPAYIFGFALLMTLMLLGLARHYRMDGVCGTALAGVFLTELVWHTRCFDPAAPMLALPWYGVFFAVFALFPFLAEGVDKKRPAPWIAAAFAGPAQFYLIYRTVVPAWGDAYIGLLPAAFAALYIAGLGRLLDLRSIEDKEHRTRLAFFAGMALFFVSLVFPLQFDKEWITLGWALEGAALVWLYRRLPVPGLKVWAGALLGSAFVRLALNPAVLTYHARTDMPVLNWYLYAYGTAVACLLAAAWLWRPADERVMGTPVPSALRALAAVLGFLLLNIEIADFFSTGAALTFSLSGSFGQDMTYTLAWGLYAFGLLAIGIRSESHAARLGSLALLIATVSKLFLHDVWKLGQLYRVFSLMGLAAILILVSYLYQRYVLKDAGSSSAEPEVAHG